MYIYMYKKKLSLGFQLHIKCVFIQVTIYSVIFLNLVFSERPPTTPHPTQCDITFLNLNTVKDLQITKEVNSPAEVTLQKLDTNMVSDSPEGRNWTQTW